MRPRKLRVLLDLSMTLHGYCGISQDARLLYKTLATSPDIDVTGLIYPVHARTRRHRFCRAGANRSDRIANQSVFLWTIKEGPPRWPYPRPVRILARLRQLASRLATNSMRVDPLEVDKLWPAVWRMLFSQTLAADDIPLVEEGRFLLANVAWDTMYSRIVAGRRPVKVDTRGYDFLIVETARPMRVSRGTRQIVRYHDMISVLQPDTAPLARDIRWHHKAIRQSQDSFFVCNSEPTRESLYNVYPELRPQSATIPYMLADVYRPDPNPSRVCSIIDARRSAATGVQPRKALRRIPRYVMCVSTLEPRKNFLGLLQAFNAVKSRDAVRWAAPKLKLLIVGSPGWKFEPILAAMRECVASGEVIHLERVSAEELRVLYTHAEAFVFPSHAEGFGFPPLEAMLCDTPVIASDIPEHRWVLGDAALFCNSYDSVSIADAVERLVASSESTALRTQLIARGRDRAKLYSQDRCADQWLDLLQRLKHGTPAVEQPQQESVLKPGLMDRAA